MRTNLTFGERVRRRTAHALEEFLNKAAEESKAQKVSNEEG